MHVIECDIPSSSALNRNLIENAYFHDSYRAPLARPELELLATTSADIHLRAGEYAVHEGGTDRALFAVLSGKMEVVKLFDGVERTLGWRVVGTIFGEIPIAIGLPFFGGYRASEPSRIMRVEARQYFAIAAASPAPHLARLSRSGARSDVSISGGSNCGRPAWLASSHSR